MTAEVIEGEVRALSVIEPREMLAETLTPEGTVSLATRMATALKDIVERQKLYAVINGRKYPQVEAWMTIARMDNVVAREVIGGILRHEDGSYEATVELVRLSDGMVIGRGSALCGTVGDEPWKSKRPEPARRSMAVTRATSRAFRQQYSWIMALAGYEPTPAEEMPRDREETEPEPGDIAPTDPANETLRPLGPITRLGAIAKGTGRHSDLEWRRTPDGSHIGFLLEVGDGKAKPQVEIGEPLATPLFIASSGLPLNGTKVTVTGDLFEVHVPKRRMIYRIRATAIETDEWRIPADAPEPVEAASVPMGLVKDDDLSDLDY